MSQNNSELRVTILCVLIIGLIVVAVGGFILALNFAADGAKVVNETFGVRARRDKYEWFHAASQQIEARRMNIVAQREKIKALKALATSRTAQENLFIMEAELSGLISAYNTLVADYNAASAKSTWNFAKSDELPRSFELLH